MEGETDNFVFFKDSFSMRELVGARGAVFEILDDDPTENTEEPNFPSGEEYLRTVQSGLFSGDEGIEGEEEDNDDNIRGHPGLFTFSCIAEKMTNITEDGDVKKLFLRRGIGEVVSGNALVDFHYQAYVEGTDEPFDSTYLRGKPERFSLGAGQMLPGMEIALATMKKKEFSRFLIQPTLAYGRMGVPPRIPENSEVLFDIELLDFVDGVEAEALTAVETEAFKCFDKVWQASQVKYFEGNEFFKKQNFNGAIIKYQKVRNMLEFTNLANEEEEASQQKFLLKIYTNLAVCYNKINSPRKACTMCQLAERINPNYCKALFAHGRALLTLNDYPRAKDWLKRAHKIRPNDREINDELIKAIQKERDAAEEDRVSCARMFRQPISPKDNSKDDQDIAEFKTEALQLIKDFYKGEPSTETFAIGLTKREAQFFEHEAKKLGLIYIKNSDDSFTLKKGNAN